MGIDWIMASSVVLTGVIVVFMALIALIFIVIISSKCVIYIDTVVAEKNKLTLNKPIDDKKSLLALPSENIVNNANLSKPIEIENSIDEYVVAAITATINILGEETGVVYGIREIKRKRHPKVSRWSRAGIVENTKPF